MLPIANLMIEHRLIERMIDLLEGQLKKLEFQQLRDLNFFIAAVNFFRYYADLNHHGKEEDILFQSLTKKELNSAHKNIMRELILDHERGRELVRRMELAKDLPTEEQPAELKKVAGSLIALYREHINKEDKQFFLPAMQYFSATEQKEMLDKFHEFDRKITQDIFKKMVENLEKEEK